jgi:hypothetical protein
MLKYNLQEIFWNVESNIKSRLATKYVRISLTSAERVTAKCPLLLRIRHSYLRLGSENILMWEGRFKYTVNNAQLQNKPKLI